MQEYGDENNEDGNNDFGAAFEKELDAYVAGLVRLLFY